MVRDAHGTTGSCAAAILGSVRIALLCADRGLLFVFKGGIHVPTLAAFISEARGAVHQLLLGQGHQLASGQSPGAFQSTSATEGPTRAALLLVLHWCHNTLGPPIHRTGQRDVSHLMGAFLWPTPQCLGSQSHTQFLLELFRRDIREIIQTQLVGMARRELHILSQDILIVLGEGLEAHLFLRCVLVAFTKILDVLLKGLLGIWHRRDKGHTQHQAASDLIQNRHV
mmetsp:Transcript_40664/g.83112  ORF Transcript_40664/g.83112 Transcript_40664/m.83112 type:complete len:226 (+) Transcript_40664:846-1523(+)